MKNSTAIALLRLGLCCALSLRAYATVYNVNSAATLVAAVNAANVAVGPHTINLAPGTYNLAGELPLIAPNLSITFQGATANPADTVLHQTTAGTRIVETSYSGPANNIVLTFNNLTFNNGQGGDFGGGALLVGGIGSATTVRNCVFTNNRTATGSGALAGGAIENSPNGNVTVLGCRFIGNTSANFGGAIGYLNQSGGTGSLLVSNSVFAGNSAASDGGAIKADVSTGTGTLLIVDCLFETNRITSTGPTAGRGAAISHVDGPLTVNFCRFFGNAAATPANGNTLFQAGGTGSMDATKNWWGANSGPGPNDVYAPGGVISLSPWLQLRLAVGPPTGNTSVLSADLFGLSTGGAVAPPTLAGLPASPSISTSLFANLSPSLGSFSAAATQFQQGAATATFSASASGTASLQVSLDAQSLSTNLLLIADTTAPTLTISAPSSPITKSGPVSYTLTYADAHFATSTLTKSDLTLNRVGTAIGTLAISGSGATHVITFSNLTGSGTLGISVGPGTASDTFGNFAPAAGPSIPFIVDNSGTTLSLSRIAAQTNRLSLQGVPGVTYTIQSAPALTVSNWQTAGTASTTPAGQGTLDLSLGQSNRFYRAVLP